MKTPKRPRWSIVARIVIGCLLGGWAVSAVLFRYPIEHGAFPLRPKWSTELGENLVGISTSETSIVIVRTDRSTSALETNTGKVLWTVPVGSSHDAAPAGVDGDDVFVANSTAVWSLEAQTGEVKWSVPITTVTDARVLAISDCCVLINRVSRDITAYRRSDGQVAWVFPTGLGFVTAHIEGNIAYVADHGINALDVTTGLVLWTADVGVIGYSDLQSGTLYYRQRSQSTGPRVSAYDVLQQTNVWSLVLTDEFPEEVITDGKHVLVSGLTTLFALDARTGVLAWSAKLDKGHAMVLLGDAVYAVDDFTQRVVAYQLATGQELGSLRFGFPKLLAVQYDNLATANGILVIGHAQTVFAYTEK